MADRSIGKTTLQWSSYRGVNDITEGSDFMSEKQLEIIQFGNVTPEDKKNLRRFVDFHWTHYQEDPQYIPLLDYEFLGFKLIGMTGFFEPQNLFFKHAEARWFLAVTEDRVVGRCMGFINTNHNRHWNDKTGFFGLFECIDDQGTANLLLDAAKDWLREKGMDVIRGPVNLPVNEATPGNLTEGFDSRPVIYYHYNKPYYQKLLETYGLNTVKRVLSWEIEVARPLDDKINRLARKIIDRYKITIEKWGDRSLQERKEEMLSIYNEAWNDNWGFVPFTREEFFSIVDDMMLIMDKEAFVFLYVNGESAAFFGAVPNVMEKIVPWSWCRRCELLRAIRLILNAKRTEGFRLGYLGVRRKFRRIGLDGVMIWKQKKYAMKKKFTYCDAGWVLEDNVMVTRMVDLMGGKHSKTYTVYEGKL